MKLFKKNALPLAAIAAIAFSPLASAQQISESSKFTQLHQVVGNTTKQSLPQGVQLISHIDKALGQGLQHITSLEIIPTGAYIYGAKSFQPVYASEGFDGMFTIKTLKNSGSEFTVGKQEFTGQNSKQVVGGTVSSGEVIYGSVVSSYGSQDSIGGQGIITLESSIPMDVNLGNTSIGKGNLTIAGNTLIISATGDDGRVSKYHYGLVSFDSKNVAGGNYGPIEIKLSKTDSSVMPGSPKQSVSYTSAAKIDKKS